MIFLLGKVNAKFHLFFRSKIKKNRAIICKERGKQKYKNSNNRYVRYFLCKQLGKEFIPIRRVGANIVSFMRCNIYFFQGYYYWNFRMLSCLLCCKSLCFVFCIFFVSFWFCLCSRLMICVYYVLCLYSVSVTAVFVEDQEDCVLAQSQNHFCTTSKRIVLFTRHNFPNILRLTSLRSPSAIIIEY